MSKRVKLEDLIVAEILRPPFAMHVTFKGQDFSAEIDNDGYVLLEGKRYTSLSLAGGYVRAKITGPPVDGKPYRRVNGWNFWSYIDEKGRIHKMVELRKELARLSSSCQR